MGRRGRGADVGRRGSGGARRFGAWTATATAATAMAMAIGFAAIGTGTADAQQPPRRPRVPAPPPPTAIAPAPSRDRSAEIDVDPRAYNVPNIPPPRLSPEALSIVEAEERNNAEIYEAVNKSVVNITTTVSGTGAFGEDVSSSGTGSGFVIDRSGHIVTNFHVVEGARRINATLFDGSSYPARVVGVDPPTDVAVLRIIAPAPRLYPISMGDSNHLRVGQKVLALGNPFGLERTLTTGVISSLNRSLQAKPNEGRLLKELIQTDAAVNPGNSGGPLVNSRGQVIGMNTAIYSRTGQSAGISFAVPINAVKRILKPLIEDGQVVRADLGVSSVMIVEQGLLVVNVAPDGPADRAGIRPLRFVEERLNNFLVRRRPDTESADIIVAVDDKPVKTTDQMLTAVEERKPGDRAKVTVLRGGELVDLLVILGKT